MQALGTSGDERVSRAIPGKILYSSPTVLVNIETDTGTDNVRIEYISSESSGNQHGVSNAWRYQRAKFSNRVRRYTCAHTLDI